MFEAVSPPIMSSKTVHTASGMCQAYLLLELKFQLTHASGSNKQAWHILDAVCTIFELLMMGEETASNV